MPLLHVATAQEFWAYRLLLREAWVQHILTPGHDHHHHRRRPMLFIAALNSIYFLSATITCAGLGRFSGVSAVMVCRPADESLP